MNTPNGLPLAMNPKTRPATSDAVPSTALLKVDDWWKRPFDLAVLTLVHLALAPVWLLLWTAIPLAIWLHDRGPVFYTQRRLGKHGRVFRVYKFRSMIPNAEEDTGAVWAADDDPRVTPVGRFLRDRALDELPQVINMWKGDYSLVGPRARATGIGRAVRPPDTRISATPPYPARHDRPGPGLWTLLHPPPGINCGTTPYT